MQRRFHISYHTDFASALEAKHEAQKKQPGKFFQIRKRQKNYDLVGRVSITEAMESEQNNPLLYSKRKPKKKLWKRKVDQDQTINANQL